MATPGPHPAITAEGLPSQLPDIDPEETADWLESLDGLLEKREGTAPGSSCSSCSSRRASASGWSACAAQQRLHQHDSP
jgi:pyruvate dehydrogenase complex dehydrogenase (E1) component